MSIRRNAILFLSVVVIGLLFVGLLVAQRGPASSVVLTGEVTSNEGTKMEGVAVSARAASETFTTTVYTKQDGAFSFPALKTGAYKLSAQAVGFELAVTDLTLAGSRPVRQAFKLKALADFTSQLNSDEVVAGLPDETPYDRRMKRVFLNSCTSCHPANFVLQNRFDAKGWKAIINFMRKTDMFAVISDPDRAAPVIKAYEEELIAYLTRVRGPESGPTKFKLIPRPTGAAADVVITEYDLSPPEQPGVILKHNGTVWAEGTPSAHDAFAAHDVGVDSKGHVWFQDQNNPYRTIGVLDPETGSVSGYTLKGRDGSSVGTHGVGVDANDNVWFTNTEDGQLSKFDPRTKEFTRFPLPPGMQRITRTIVDFDSKGNIWTISPAGAVQLDPKTGKYTEHKSATPKGNPYGVAIDSKDHAWWAQMGTDRMSEVDPITGKVTSVAFEPLDEIPLTDYDRKMVETIEATPTSGFFFAKGPRRLGADRNGDKVWVANFYGDTLARIDINTREVKEYPLPYTRPYHVVVDKNRMVWVALMNTDRVAKFDPFTEKFTEYLLPTRGTEPRHVTVDNRTDPPSVWIPYFRTNKIARLQFPSQAKSATK